MSSSSSDSYFSSSFSISSSFLMISSVRAYFSSSFSISTESFFSYSTNSTFSSLSSSFFASSSSSTVSYSNSSDTVSSATSSTEASVLSSSSSSTTEYSLFSSGRSRSPRRDDRRSLFFVLSTVASAMNAEDITRDEPSLSLSSLWSGSTMSLLWPYPGFRALSSSLAFLIDSYAFWSVKRFLS